MPGEFYSIPPSFGALMKRQVDRGFIDELPQYRSYDELLKRYPTARIEEMGMIRELMESHRVESFPALEKIFTFRELTELLTEQHVIPKIQIEESVRQHISLYLSSRPGEYYFDHQYGCIIHGYDFRQLRETPSKDQIKRSVEEYLRKFEKRIIISKTDIDINDVEEKVDGGSPRICRYIQITISSMLAGPREPLPDMKFRLVRYS